MLMEVTWRWDESFVSRSGWMFVNLFAEVFWRIWEEIRENGGARSRISICRISAIFVD
jgi:hypothetical protein